MHTLLIALLATAGPVGPAAPAALAPHQVPVADTLRLATGAGGAAFAWGTVQLRDGQRLRAYLPAGAAGAEFTLPYYLTPPDQQGQPAPRLRHLAVGKVQWMLVRGQYSERLPGSRAQRVPDRLAARLEAGPVELFVARSLPLVVSFLGATPMLSQPTATTPVTVLPEGLNYYLRRPGQPAVLLSAEQFASQAAPFLAADPELARRVAAGQPGYRLPDVARLVRQYNQHAQP